jgi:predicted DNA-binding protein YlxM (UPF0122 family)
MAHIDGDFKELTLEEIAKIFHVTREAIRGLERKAIDFIKNHPAIAALAEKMNYQDPQTDGKAAILKKNSLFEAICMREGYKPARMGQIAMKIARLLDRDDMEVHTYRINLMQMIKALRKAQIPVEGIWFGRGGMDLWHAIFSPQKPDGEYYQNGDIEDNIALTDDVG